MVVEIGNGCKRKLTIDNTSYFLYQIHSIAYRLMTTGLEDDTNEKLHVL